MAKKPEISDEEVSLFRNAMGKVKPLSAVERVKTKPKKSVRATMPQKQKHSIAGLSDDLYLKHLSPEEWLLCEDRLHFARSGLQHKLISKLKRGNISVEATLDLHRLTADEALIRMERFIDQCYQKKLRWILIIHGKGRMKIDQLPKLKNLANQYLRKKPRVLAFHSAKAKDGGAGAIYVLLSAK